MEFIPGMLMLNFQKPVTCLLWPQETFYIIIEFTNSCAATVNYTDKKLQKSL